MRFVVSATLAIGTTAAFAQTCQPLEEYDEIVGVVTERFFDQEFNGLNWNERVVTHRREIACTDSAERVAKTVNALLAELEASHTELYTPKDLHYWGLNSLFSFDDPDAYEIHFSGVWAEQQGDSWYAKHIFEGSPAERAGVLVGDELIAIDGKRFAPLDFGEEAATLTISSDGRTTRNVLIQPTNQNIMRGFVDAARASAQVLTVNGKRVGYFHLWTAGDAILESMNSALDDFVVARVDAILFDYRGGYGGTSEDYLKKVREDTYLRQVPKYFLIDDSVRSGKEMLAGIVRRDELGTLVGSRTAGYFLGASPFRFFDDKYFLLLAIGGGPVPGIGEIEGVGIEPHVYAPSCRMYCSGRDPQIQRAMELIGG
jgi:carboxyl-terminal processing protease